MSKAKLTKTLQHLKGLSLDKAHASLWIIKRTLKSGAATYRVAAVKTEPKLQRKLVSIVASAVRSANHVLEYEYLTADQDGDTALGLNIADTDLQSIADQIAEGSDAPQVMEAKDLFDSWAYAVEVTLGKERVIGVRKISEGWKLKQKDKILSTIFQNHMLLDYEDQLVFKLDKAIDFFACDGGLFILDKKRFEAALNFRAGMEANVAAVLDEFAQLGLVTDVEIIRAKVGTRLSHLRRISMIKNNGYHRRPGFMEKVKAVCAKNGWEVEFDGSKAIVTEGNVELLLKLLNNDRLASMLTEEIFDVTVKHRVDGA
jgi:hypothetical protein